MLLKQSMQLTWLLLYGCRIEYQVSSRYSQEILQTLECKIVFLREVLIDGDFGMKTILTGAEGGG